MLSCLEITWGITDETSRNMHIYIYIERERKGDGKSIIRSMAVFVLMHVSIQHRYFNF